MDRVTIKFYEEALSLSEMSVNIVSAIGLDDENFNTRDRPNVFDSHIRFALTKLMLQHGFENIMDDLEKDDANERFLLKYGAQQYREGADLATKDEVVIGVVTLFDDLQNAYRLKGLLTINPAIVGVERLLQSSILATNNNVPRELTNFIAMKQSQRSMIEDDSDDDEESVNSNIRANIEEINNPIDEQNVYENTIKLLDSGSVGDHQVTFENGRVISEANTNYAISMNALIVPTLGQLKLTSSEIMFDVRRLFSHFLQFGSITQENIFDFTTLIALLAQDVAIEKNDKFGDISRKVNYRGFNKREMIFPTIAKNVVIKMKYGEIYWFICEHLLKCKEIERSLMIDECERLLVLLIDWLDLSEEMPDDKKQKPDTIRQQNINFRLKDNKLQGNDVVALSYSCQVNVFLTRAIGMRSQLRTLLSAIMIKVANRYIVVKEEGVENRNMRVWTLLPLSLTNSEYHRTELYSLFIILKLIENSIV